MNRSDAVTDPYAARLAGLAEFATWPEIRPERKRHALAMIERYHRERDLGWGPDKAWQRAMAMTQHYLETH